MSNERWAVVEQAGFVNERVIHNCTSYDDACCALHEQYSSPEIDELHVSIMKWDAEQGDWTTEY